MSKRIFVWLLATFFLANASHAEAQQVKKVPRIGFLSTGSAATFRSRIEAFRQSLRDLGYSDGKSILIEYRYAEGKRERWADLAAEIVRLQPDVIVVSSTGFTTSVMQATTTIPIVVASASDLVGTGLVASLARPGGNITGLTNIAPDLSGKRLELLKEVVPKASRVAVLLYPNSTDWNEVKQTESAAPSLGVKIQVLEVRDPKEFDNAYTALTKQQAGALIIILGSFTNFHRRQLVDLAVKNRLPTMCEDAGWTEEGCLLSYGHDPHHNWRRAAVFVDKILKGTKPADLPVEQPMKFELVINLKTAKQIGLTIPPNVLARADRVIR